MAMMLTSEQPGNTELKNAVFSSKDSCAIGYYYLNCRDEIHYDRRAELVLSNLTVAADAGNEFAQNLLGSFYDPLDLYRYMSNTELAFVWHSKAAKQGNPISQGYMYRNTPKTSPDWEFWCKKLNQRMFL
jgi:TPR repeat protein